MQGINLIIYGNHSNDTPVKWIHGVGLSHYAVVLNLLIDAVVGEPL